ncbi:MAG: C25 family cysteine peptidase [Flavobacteriales bacterium]
MKRPLLLAVLLGSFGVAMAQPYGNEWIDYGKQYWKVKIVAPTTDREEIFRIDSTTLANAGFPLAGLDPHRIQFFGREKEVPIWIEGEADNVFNSTDFIEFYAMENDGWMDAAHWESPTYQSSTTYNLYNDTICYYLTLANIGEQPKRIQPYQNTDFGGLPVRNWYWGESLVQNNAGYQKGDRDPVGAQGSFMGSGEGWVSALANDLLVPAPTVYNNPLPTAEAYYGPGAPDATLTTTLFGESSPCAPNDAINVHHLQLLYGQSGNQSVLLDDTLTAWETRHVNITIPNSQIVPSCIVTLKSVDLAPPCPTQVTNTVSAISDIRLEYPRITDMLGTGVFKMWFDDDAQEDDANVTFGNVFGTPVFHVMNGDTTWRVLPTNVGGTFWSARLPANGAGDRSFVYGMHSVYVPYLTQVSLATPSGYFTNYAANELDSACIIVTHTSLLNAAQQYADYRETSPRNPMPTLVADVEQLYHQYGGGTIKSGMAIRRFAKHLLDTWSTPPQALFLIGKSVMSPSIGTDIGVRRPTSTVPTTYQRCLVPTFGSPPSDVCLTIGLTGDQRVMAIPVGRLSADNETEVLDYLGKVQSFESFNQPEEWMKNILHFRGGFTPSEWAQFSQRLGEWEGIAEDTTFFSGAVTNFRKNTGNIFAQASADSVRHFIEDTDKGVTMMTFLAHASGQGFDINIDQPSGYNWQGKHPLILGNSCYSGNIHLNYLGGANSASEAYVIAGNDGAIGFLASVDVGTVNALSPYTNQFYRSFSYVNYGKSIGQHMKHAIFSQLSQLMNQSYVHNCHTMTLHGDPAIVLPSWEHPEFTIKPEDIRILPAQVTAELDTFTVRAVVTNIGAGTYQPVVVRMIRTLPNGTQQLDYQVQLPGLLFKDTVEFKVPLLNDELGLNTFTVMIDREPDEIPEQFDEEFNNMAVQTTTIISAELLPIWPYKFAITPDAGPILKASTSDPFAPTAPYVFQIDTTDLFNSPVLEMGTVTAPGGVISWQPQFIYALNGSVDSLVFFWRCSPDSTGPDGYKWKESSFQHIPNRTGWGQAHYFQFKDDNYNNVVYDRPNREFDFFTGQHEIRANVLGSSSGFQNNQNEWFIDLQWQDNNGCGGVPAFYVAVVDPATFTPWITGPPGGLHDFGNYNYPGSFGCRSRPEAFFMFKQSTPAQLDGMRIMLQDSVPVGHYVIVYTWKYLNRFVGDTGLGVPLYDYLETMGATDIRTVPDSVPYIFMVRKGYPNTAIDTAGATSTSFISQTLFCGVDGNEGLMRSPPSMQFLDYDALYWDETPRNANDSTTIRLWGREADGTETLLNEQPSPLDSLNTLDAVVNPAQYPEVRVGSYLTDFNWPDAEPAQMRRWQILGDPAPECAINPPLGFFVQADGLYEGQPGRVAVAVQNISTFAMDSLLLAAWIVDANNVRHGIHYHRNAPLPVGGVILDTISFNTEDIAGGNFIFIEANPVDSATGVYDQPEQYHFNNYASLRFTIREDRENPLLDITFDGIHILDGDIVSAKPEVQMTLDDENLVLLMDEPTDTILFKVFLTDPDGYLQRIYFRSNGEEVLQFVPADGAENIAKIFYRPTFLVDGKYTLQVQAKDLSDNASGDKDQKITFEVVNRPSITNVLNYPNPFTTSTRFVFTVTGSEPPTQMRVQIMTVGGRVVRTINAIELGPMHVGRNITEFAWDGTDEFGDKLARGVYLYRVDARLNGQDIDHRESGADPWIEKGMGKMYLMR